ncbi:MAG: hypothetical protein KDD75_00785, partial [Caldilineaceae bacterium]|nr:hypothetical protein [Caldilineaceae bacterium]
APNAAAQDAPSLPTGGCDSFLEAPPGASEPGVAAANLNRVLRYEAGRTYHYGWRVQVDTHVYTQGQDGLQETGVNTVGLRGDVNVAIVGLNDRGEYVGEVTVAGLIGCNLDGTGQIAPADTVMAAALATPIRFTQATNGVVTSVAYPPNAPPEAVNLQQSLVGVLQVTLQEGVAYEASEQGVQGSYQASYTASEQDGRLQVERLLTERSYANLAAEGDVAEALSLTDRTTYVLDGSSGVFHSIHQQQNVSIGGPAAGDSAPAQGVTSWSEVVASTALDLQRASETAVATAAAVPDGYVQVSLGLIAEPSLLAVPSAAESTRVSLEEELVRWEVAAVQADASEAALTQFDRLRGLAVAQGGEVVVAKAAERLRAVMGQPVLASAYIDLLGAIGTPAAQSALAEALTITVAAGSGADTAGDRVALQALYAIAGLESPTPAVLDAVQLAAERSDFAQRNAAVTVLGAVVGVVAKSDPDVAARVQVLADGLAQAQGEDQQVVYLMALGNTQLESAVRIIQSYAGGADGAGVPSKLAQTAQAALRQVETGETGLYVPDGTAGVERQAAVEGAAQSEVAASLPSFRFWGNLYGGKGLGIEFPGVLMFTPWDRALSVRQDVDAYIWQKKLDLVAATFYGRLESGSHAVTTALILGNTTVAQRKVSLGCGQGSSIQLYKRTVPIIDANLGIPFGPFTIGFRVKANGAFQIDQALSARCDLNGATLAGTLTPRAFVLADVQAKVALKIVVEVARGGIGVSARLLDTSVPVGASVGLQPQAARLCISVDITFRPLSGKLYIFGEARIPPFGWARVDKTLAKFEVKAQTAKLYDTCYSHQVKPSSVPDVYLMLLPYVSH